jgi:hypothetical protein
MLLQVVAGAYFFVHSDVPRALAVLNAAYVGCTIVAACGAATAWLTRREQTSPWIETAVIDTLSALMGVWALAWWLGANFSEIDKFAPPRHAMALCLTVVLLTAWGVSWAGQARRWTHARYAALVLVAGAIVAGVFEGLADGAHRHVLHDTMIFAMPAAFVTLYALLRLHERDNAIAGLRELHFLALLLLAVILGGETLWIADELAPVTLWRMLAWEIVPAAFVAAIIFLDRHRAWPLTSQRGAYLAAGAPVLLCVAIAAAAFANFTHPGSGSGVPYVPVASFFDVAQIAVIAVTIAWVRAAEGDIRTDLLPLARGAAPALGFLWLSAMALRIAHHWGGVAFDTGALMASGMAQSMLSLLWTALALALMIGATRKLDRDRWFLGFALLGVVGAKFILVDVVNKGTITWTLSLIGVGLLILAASYFSPAPPRASKEAPAL